MFHLKSEAQGAMALFGESMVMTCAVRLVLPSNCAGNAYLVHRGIGTFRINSRSDFGRGATGGGGHR